MFIGSHLYASYKMNNHKFIYSKLIRAELQSEPK